MEFHFFPGRGGGPGLNIFPYFWGHGTFANSHVKTMACKGASRDTAMPRQLAGISAQVIETIAGMPFSGAVAAHLSRAVFAVDPAADSARKFSRSNRAGELWVEAEAKLGEELDKIPKARGTRGLGRPKLGGPKSEPPKDAPTLDELGIDKKLSTRAGVGGDPCAGGEGQWRARCRSGEKC